MKSCSGPSPRAQSCLQRLCQGKSTSEALRNPLRVVTASLVIRASQPLSAVSRLPEATTTPSLLWTFRRCNLATVPEALLPQRFSGIVSQPRLCYSCIISSCGFRGYYMRWFSILITTIISVCAINFSAVAQSTTLMPDGMGGGIIIGPNGTSTFMSDGMGGGILIGPN